MPVVAKTHLLLLTILFGFIGCDPSKQHQPKSDSATLTSQEQIFNKIHATGGTPAKFAVCPQTPYDTIVPIESFKPAAQPGFPEMTVVGIQNFMEEHQITTIEELLNRLPDSYRNNFSLVEHTRATGQSNVQFPRIVLFGPDGRFLLNIGTKADDPKYNLLDVGELHDDTGQWEFSVFDFNGPKPTLSRNDASCVECHGDKNSRPVWGTNLLWTGVFGDNIAPGPQGEAMDTKHAVRMNEIIDGQGNSPRFDFLLWNEERPRRGGKRKLANHILGVDLFLSNIAMGSATARGAFTRLSRFYPEKYQDHREDLVFAYYLKKGNAYISEQEQAHIELVKQTLGIEQYDLDSLLLAMGLDTKEAFSVSTLHALESPITKWSMGRGDLHDMLMLQVLDDLRWNNPTVDTIVSDRVIENAIFGCPDTASSIAEVIDYKMLHLFYLQGQAKYDVHRVFYPLDVEDIYSRVFIPVSHHLIGYLRERMKESNKLAQAN